jgi:hypothetical protein
VQTKAFAAILVACVVLIAPIRAWAGPVEVYTLEGVSYSSPNPNFASGTLSGTFDYNGSAYTNIDITATGGIIDGDVFTTLDGSGPSFLGAAASNLDYIVFDFATPLSSSGGTDAITGSYVLSQAYYNLVAEQPGPDCGVTSNECTENIADAGYVTDVSSTPIPAALPLFGTGICAFGLLVRRRKRRDATAIAAV